MWKSYLVISCQMSHDFHNLSTSNQLPPPLQNLILFNPLISQAILQLSAQCRILSQATEFAHLGGISRFLQNVAEFSMVPVGDKGTNNYGIFWSCLGSHRKLINTYRHDCDSSSNGRNIENIEDIWNIASLLGRQTVSVNYGYWQQILHIWSGLCGRINLLLYVENLQTDLQNTKKIAAENCGP